MGKNIFSCTRKQIISSDSIITTLVSTIISYDSVITSCDLDFNVVPKHFVSANDAVFKKGVRKFFQEFPVFYFSFTTQIYCHIPGIENDSQDSRNGKGTSGHSPNNLLLR